MAQLVHTRCTAAVSTFYRLITVNLFLKLVGNLELVAYLNFNELQMAGAKMEGYNLGKGVLARFVPLEFSEDYAYKFNSSHACRMLDSNSCT